MIVAANSLSDTICNRTRMHLQFKTIAVSQRRNDVIFLHIIPKARIEKLAIFVIAMFAILIPSLPKQLSAPHVKTISPITEKAIQNFCFCLFTVFNISNQQARCFPVFLILCLFSFSCRGRVSTTLSICLRRKDHFPS